jgi:hypothetical protein
MDLISFKNIKLFKSSGPPRAPLPADGAGASHHPARKLDNPFVYVFLTALVIAYFASYVPSRSLPELNPGDIAGADVVAPADLTLEDAETTAARRLTAAKSIMTVKVFDRNVFHKSEDKVSQ